MRNIILSLVLLSACSAAQTPCQRVFSDGSSACDLPVMAEELDGKWCDPTPGRFLCFEAYRDAYAFISNECFETGDMSGGLEFMPHRKTHATRCFGQGEFYSASVDWTDTGLRLHITGENRPVVLSYVSK